MTRAARDDLVPSVTRLCHGRRRRVTAVTLPLRGPVSCHHCVTGSTSALSQVSWLAGCVLSPLTPKAKHIQD